MIETKPLLHPTNARKTRCNSFDILRVIILSSAFAGFGSISFFDRSTQSNHAGTGTLRQDSMQLRNVQSRSLMETAGNSQIGVGTLPVYDQKGIQSLSYNLKTSWPLLLFLTASISRSTPLATGNCHFDTSNSFHSSYMPCVQAIQIASDRVNPSSKWCLVYPTI